MRLKVGVSRREATDGDGSVGATCEIEVEVPGGTGDAELVRIRDRWLEMCENTVDDEIDRLRTTAVRPPAPSSPRAQSVPSRSTGHEGRTAAPPPATTPARRARDEFDRDDDRNLDGEGAAPTNGRQLLGWAAKQDPDAKGLVFSFGKKKGYPSRIVDWTDDQVQTAYRFARDRQMR
ncbi:MAG: hypothetical protein ACYC61_29910 [Isosphaeraceae bacterium]